MMMMMMMSSHVCIRTTTAGVSKSRSIMKWLVIVQVSEIFSHSVEDLKKQKLAAAVVVEVEEEEEEERRKKRRGRGRGFDEKFDNASLFKSFDKKILIFL